MRRALALIVLFGCATVPTDPGILARDLRAALPDGEWGVYFRDLQDGDTLEMNAEEAFHPASTLKILVMVKVYRDVADGRYRLDDEIPVEKSFRSAATKDPKPFEVEPTKALAPKVGGRDTVRSLVEHMITASDNLATNNLIRQAGGPEAITAFVRSLGIERSNVLRYIEDEQAFQEGLNSVAVPREYGKLFELLWRGEVVSPAASAEMLAVLSRLKDNRMLPGKLPPGTRVAHKTGAITGVRNDAGLVTMPDGRTYVAVFYSRRLGSEKQGEASLAAASRVLYDYMSGKR
jgi:beta-lactamase class A